MQLTVPVLSVILFGVSAVAYVALIISGNASEAEPFKLVMGAAVGAGLGVAIPKPTP